MKIGYAILLLFLVACTSQPGDDDETPLLPEANLSKFSLRSSNGNYVVTTNDFYLVASETDPGKAEIFEKIQQPNGGFALKALNGKFVCADRVQNNRLIANRDYPGDWETFTISINQDKATLKASNGKFVCADQNNDNNVFADRDAAGAWETFTIEFSKK